MAEAGRHTRLETPDERIPVYMFPENAGRALGKVATYAAWRTQPPGLFWDFNDIRAEDAREVCRRIIDARGGDWMTSDECRQLGSAFGLPMVSSVLTHSAEEAAAAATAVGLPVAAKLSAPTIVHKSEVDGVRLNLTTSEAVRGAFDELIAAGRQHGLSDLTMSVLIQPMILGGTEMIVGLVEDPLFGPLVGLGPGGVLVEALGAVRFRIAPLTDRDADDLVAEVRRTKLLDGYRGRPRGDVDALTELVLRVSRLAEEIPEIVELDLNPVIVMPAGQGCRIVDARVKVGGPN